MPGADPFHRDNMLAVSIYKGSQARDDAFIFHDTVFRSPHEHGARPAVAFTAANFCSGKPHFIPDKIKERRSGSAARADPLIVKYECYHLTKII
jgi:hypothetical protein